MAVTLKRKLDYDDYAGIPSDRNRYEIMDGDLFVAPAPSPVHQRVSRRLRRILEDYFHGLQLGEVFNAPIDVILGQHDVVFQHHRTGGFVALGKGRIGRFFQCRDAPHHVSPPNRR